MTLKKLINFVFILVVVGTLSVPFPVQGRSQENPIYTQPVAASTCDTAQFVLLVDFSNSMLRNDPTDLRFTGSLHVADVLASNYLSARLVSTRLNRPKKLELAVIQFASSARIGLDWTTIAPKDYVAWQDQRAEMAKIVDPGSEGESQIKAEIGNGTNQKRAFETLSELLEKKDPPVSGCPERTIILLTDGLPDHQGEPYLDEELETYMLGDQAENGNQGGLLGLVRNTLNSQGDRVYVIGINNSNDNYWRYSEYYWQAITCEGNNKSQGNPFWSRFDCDPKAWDEQEPARAEKVNNPSELGLRLDKIISYRLGSGLATIQPGSITMPPYLDRVVFNFYKPDIENLIELRDPQGKLLECNSDNPQVLCEGVSEGIQTVQIVRPQPGKYDLSTTAKTDEYVITRELIFAQGSLANPNQEYQQFTTAPLVINLVDSEGNALPSYGDRYPLLIEATVTPPSESGIASYPISLADTGQSSLEGNFTPLYGKVNHISITASVIDDEGKKWEVLQAPFADFDLLVAPVGIQIGTPVSERVAAGCGLVQFTGFEVPIKLINTQTNQPAVLSLPVKLDYDKSQDIVVTDVIQAGSGTAYTLRAISNGSGDQDIVFSASVANPQNATQKIEFDKKDLSLRFMPGRFLLFNDFEINPSADPLTIWLENMQQSWFGGKGSEYLVIGRRFFIIYPGVEINAQIIEKGAQNDSPILPQQIPSLSFVPDDGGAPISGGAWQSNKDEGFRSYTKDIGLGCYSVSVDATSPACEATLDTSTISGRRICLVPGISERILVIISIAVLLGLVVLLIRTLICKFTNPLKGYLAILPVNGGKANWYNSIFGWSCWNFSISEPTENGLVTRIVIKGAFKKEGTFKLCYYRLGVPNETKGLIYEEVERDIAAWEDVQLKTGFKIIWKRTDDEFPHH